MVTISHTTKEIIENKPFLLEALAKGIINYGALADMLHHDVERIMRKKVKHSAVMMALRRYAETLEKKFPEKREFYHDSDIMVKSHLCEITIHKSATVLAKIKSLYSIFDFEGGDVLNIIQGNYQIGIITNEKYKEKVVKMLHKSNVVRTETDLSSLSIKFSQKVLYQPGFIYRAVRAIAWENINIIEIISTLTELTFILKDDESVKGYNVLQKLLKNRK